jgi:hypothetical protein
MSLWLPYVVERPKSKSPNQAAKRRKTKGQGFYPFLRWLSMDEHITPLVWSTLAQYGMLSASFTAAGDTREHVTFADMRDSGEDGGESWREWG